MLASLSSIVGCFIGNQFVDGVGYGIKVGCVYGEEGCVCEIELNGD